MEVRADSSLNGVQSTVEIETSDGRRLSTRCDYPLGSPENRLSRAQVEDKFRTYAAGRLADVEGVIGAVAQLEDQASVRTFMQMLREGHSNGERAQAAALAHV